MGCSLFPSFPGAVPELADLLDFVEIGPDTLCREVERSGRTALTFVPSLLGEALEAVGDLDVVVHGLELSIGTADGWNCAYVDMLDDFAGRCSFAWHSEHLGFLFARTGSGRRRRVRHAGVPLPMPFTQETVDVVAPRARALATRYGRPFLLENAAYYLPDLPADAGWDEAELLARLVEAADCHLLLDLFNLHVNATNHGLDVLDLLGRIPLDRVVEIHVAGGDEAAGFLLDSHSAVVPDEVWSLLRWTLDRAPNVAGVVYEVLETHLPRVGLAAVRSQLEQLRSVCVAAAVTA